MAINTAQFAIGTAIQKILGPQSNPTQVILHNAQKSSNEYIWFGNSTVSTATGLHLDDSETYQFVLQPGNALYAVSNDNANPHALHVMWQVL